MTKFINEKKPYISTALKDYRLGSVSFPANEVVTKLARFLQDYERYRDEVANGSISKTALKYPGMTEFFRIGGISAQAQTKHVIRTATDQRGEQTINKDAKSTGNSIQSGSHTNTANKHTKMTKTHVEAIQ